MSNKKKEKCQHVWKTIGMEQVTRNSRRYWIFKQKCTKCPAQRESGISDVKDNK